MTFQTKAPVLRMSLSGRGSSLNAFVTNPGATVGDVGGVCRVTEVWFAMAKGF